MLEERGAFTGKRIKICVFGTQKLLKIKEIIKQYQILDIEV